MHAAAVVTVALAALGAAQPPYVLDLLPSPPFPQTAFHNASFHSWGGGVIQVPASVDAWPFHLFASAFSNGCGLGQWVSNSEAIHAVSDSPTGPFQFVDTAIPVYQHNVSPLLVNESGKLTFAIWSIGMAPEGKVQNCSKETQLQSARRHGAELCELHISDSLYGPWTPVLNATGGGLSLFPGTNPVGYYNDSTATMFVVGHGGANFTVNIATDWRSGNFGPMIKLFPSVVAGYCGEDPYIWFDPDATGTDNAGVWKVLFHQYNCSEPHSQERVGGYAQSLSSSIAGGWTVQSNADPAYTVNVEMQDGSVTALSRRERPHLLFGRTATGHLYPSVLYNGVCPMPSGNTDCFTLSQSIRPPPGV